MAATQQAPDISQPDPAEVLLISGYFGFPHQRVEHVYRKRGCTYAIVADTRRSPFDPPDAYLWRYDGEQDVTRNGVTENRIVMTEVAFINGARDGAVEWYDDADAGNEP